MSMIFKLKRTFHAVTARITITFFQGINSSEMYARKQKDLERPEYFHEARTALRVHPTLIRTA